MPARPKNPQSGIDLAAARKTLAGVPARRLDSDWLATDRAGKVAFFAANDRGPIPRAADTAQVTDALEAIARAAAMRKTIADRNDTQYRGFAEQARDPVFDVPRTASGEAQHEHPVEDYPLLVVGADPRLREVAAEWNARDVITRTGFGLVFPVVGPFTYEELHQSALCLGCRVLDDPTDPRPRAPEALAAAGVYSYVHTGQATAHPYRRVAGPTVASDLADLEPVVQRLASLVRLSVLFEDEAAVQPLDFEACSD